MKRSRILGTGHYVPENVVTNEDLLQRLNTSDEWIQQRTGVKERRFCPPNTKPSELAHKVTLNALEASGLRETDIGFIICTIQTPEHFFPGTGCYIQARLGIPGVPSLDVRDQCTGFLYGLSIADAYIRLGQYQTILLVSTEIHSTGLEWSDHGRHVSVLFGDGAGAVILGGSDSDKHGILGTQLHADGSFADELCLSAPGTGYDPWISHEMIDQGLHFPRMNGKVVFKEAVSCMTRVSKAILKEHQMSIEDVDYFIPHQANMRITEAVVKLTGMNPGKVDNSIRKYGNCASASVPISFDEAVRDGRIQPGDTVLMSTFASGFTWGAALLKW